MTLPLYGTASQSAGFCRDKGRSVIRLRSADSITERHAADFALAKTPDEIQRAMGADWPSIFVVSDGSIDLPDTFDGRLVAVPLKYNYLADGDVLGIDHASRKFRALFRRNSDHNSFLVTERCNNYCLMCSQPPKDVDDRWILSEIRESLPLIDPAVRAHVVQSKGAFDETILGILKLKDRGQRVEIRIVLHALTAPIIEETGRWIARNLPFADHVALMGLENTGFAIANDAMLWMDPVDYGEGLARAIDHLVAAGLNVSIYNLPKCVLPKSVWPHALQSISDWKNGFVEECDRCDEKNTCSGFFTTGCPRFSRGVSAITSQRGALNPITG